MLLDTSVLVDIDRGGVDEKVSRLDDAGRHSISIVSATELFLGVELQYDPDTASYIEVTTQVERLLARFDMLQIDRAVATAAARMTAELREQGSRLDDLHDTYIAATAETAELAVLTANFDHFDRIPSIQAIDWTTY
ncbi:MAG: type II toxin-antitoxin system VapC family toxin [Halobacteriales archaeon]